KNEGCLKESVPSNLRKCNMLRPMLARGVGKTMIFSALGTMSIVESASFSFEENRFGIPRIPNRRSTSSADNEIMCDKLLALVIASQTVRYFPYTTAPRSCSTPVFKQSNYFLA